MTNQQLTARQFMIANVIQLSPDMEIMDAIHELVDKRISGAPVVDSQGNLVGVLTERDCITQVLAAGYYGEAAGRVSEFMSSNVESVDADANLIDIAERFAAGSYRRFPVLDNNRLVGIISRRDVLRAVLQLSS